MKTETQNQPELEKVKDYIANIKVAMITTMDEEGNHRSRPMQTLKMDADGCLWFFTDRHSPKLTEVHENPNVNLSYADNDDQTYVSISGTAEQVDDETMKKDLWNPILKAWYPKGMEDPNLAILKVKVNQADYWDGKTSKMVEAFRIAKAIVTGERHGYGEEGKIKVQSN